MMQLRATLTIDLDVADFIEAGRHETILREGLRTLLGSYPDASLSFKERRPRVESQIVTTRSVANVLNRRIVYE